MTTEPLRIDATSYKALLTCPLLYQRSMIEGWRARKKGLHVWWGSLLHDAFEHYDTLRLGGTPAEVALDKALETLMHAVGERDTEGRWRPYEPEGKSGSKTAWTAARSLVNYADWSEDPERGAKMRPILLPGGHAKAGQPALEVYWELLDEPLSKVFKRPVYLCGKFDRILEEPGTDYYWIGERKTTEKTVGPYYLAQYDPNPQMDFYSIAAEHSEKLFGTGFKIKGVVLEPMQTGVNFNRFHRLPIRRSREQRAEALAEIRYWAERDLLPLLEGEEPRRRTSSCRMCDFRAVDARNASMRSLYLRGDFVATGSWDPRGSDATNREDQ